MTANFESYETEGHKVYGYEIIDSTNLEAKRLAAQGEAGGIVVTARAQTAGRGRRGRTWESPADANLYFTLLLRPEFETQKASMLTIVMALAVAKGILENISNIPLGIKWPNDIWVNGRKVCGILTELTLDKNKIDNVIIGVGINVEAQSFPEELRDSAAALGEFGQAPDKATLLSAILRQFDALYAQFCAAGDLTPLMDEYRALSLNLGRSVRILDPKGEYEAVARDVSPTGELIVELPDGETRNVFAGEVSLRPANA
ncbi:MAG: biotin--[acetyl-CoA-carboxylase] ligase [Lachnospiraceae bacterium]|nr:biotin--[acetyl-CoA-carboxylase] ligase [Lachnospiraceae bacterium]